VINLLADFVQNRKIDGTEHRMYRWYKHEIIDAIKYFCPDRDDLIKYFQSDNMWYQDEILTAIVNGKFK